MDILAASSNSGGGFLLFVVYIALIVAGIAGFWKVFEKAGQPGWAALIPIYNLYVLLKVAGRPGWWILLFLIPFVNIVTYLIVALDVAKAFGKSTGFGVVGLWIFSYIGYVMLGFGEASYQKPAEK